LADSIFIFLLILHVGGIIAWLGGGALFISVISPALKGISQSARAEVLVSVLPRYVRYLGGSSTLAVIAGLGLYGYASSTSKSGAPFGSGTVYIDAGAAMGLIAFALVLGLVIPAARRVVTACKQVAVDQNAKTNAPKLLQRMRMGATLAVGTLAVALVLMVFGAGL
jgi:uncharacterized membrane protein